MVNVHRHCWNLHHRLFIRFIAQWHGDYVRKSLSYWHAKSWDSLLPHWLPIKLIVLNREKLTIPIHVQISQKQKNFPQFFAAFLKSILYFEYFEQKIMTLTSFVFPKLKTPKTWLDKRLKSSVSEDPSTSNLVNLSKHCWNLHHRLFTKFIDQCQVNWVGKVSLIDMQNLGTAC